MIITNQDKVLDFEYDNKRLVGFVENDKFLVGQLIDNKLIPVSKEEIDFTKQLINSIIRNNLFVSQEKDFNVLYNDIFEEYGIELNGKVTFNQALAKKLEEMLHKDHLLFEDNNPFASNEDSNPFTSTTTDNSFDPFAIDETSILPTKEEISEFNAIESKGPKKSKTKKVVVAVGSILISVSIAVTAFLKIIDKKNDVDCYSVPANQEYVVEEETTDDDLGVIFTTEYSKVVNNSPLDDNIKNILLALDNILANSTFINYTYLASKINTLKVEYKPIVSSTQTVLGEYNTKTNTIHIYIDKNDSRFTHVLQHELLHMISNCNWIEGLSEGMTELLNVEFDGQELVGCYVESRTALKLLFEIFGTDVFIAYYYSGLNNNFFDYFQNLGIDHSEIIRFLNVAASIKSDPESQKYYLEQIKSWYRTVYNQELTNDNKIMAIIDSLFGTTMFACEEYNLGKVDKVVYSKNYFINPDEGKLKIYYKELVQTSQTDTGSEYANNVEITFGQADALD